nr:MAG TPA: hypothetical protein [Caudoviricetes sp.]
MLPVYCRFSAESLPVHCRFCLKNSRIMVLFKNLIELTITKYM